MPTMKQISFTSAFIFAMLSTAIAQESTTASTQSSSLTITAATAGERVRITAPSSVVQMHVEVYAASGEKLFDQEIRGGNVFDWHLQDGQGQRLAPGAYVCVVTAKSTSGKLTQKIGTVSVEVKSVSLQPAASKQLSTLQAQTIGPVEENSSWMILGKDEPQTPTVIANDGTDGQMIRGRGALTFRIGNFFSGIDTEQMRLTEDGRLGIGTSDPRSTLDVAGTIRAQRFLVAKPKKTDTTTSGDVAQAPEAADSVQPLASGSGTQDRVAKWTDNSGTLGDSVITESSGNIGIGTPTPTQALEVANGRILASGSKTLTGPEGILEIGTTVTNNHTQASGIRLRNTFNGTANLQQALDVAPTFAPSASIALARGFISTAFFAPPPGVTITDAYGGNANTVYLNTGGAVTNGTGFAVRTPIVFGALKPTNQYGLHILNQGIFGTTNSYGLFVDAQSGSTNNYSAIFAGGNVGIGTTTPTSTLDVAGNINTSTQYNIGGNRVLSAPDMNLIAGLFSGESNSGLNNSFFGNSAGKANTTGSGNSFFGLRAGFNNTTGFDNVFIGRDSGESNRVEDFNTMIGTRADGAAGITNATAIGFLAKVTQSNSLVLGSIKGVNDAPNDTKVGIGTTAPLATLHVVAPSNEDVDNTADFEAPAIGPNHSHIHYGTKGDWYIRSAAGTGSIFGAGKVILQDTGGNVGIGTGSPDQRLTVNGEADKPGGGSWATFSDERLKTIKGRFTPGLKALMQLQPVRYEYKPDNALGLQSSGQHIGFGAQAVQKIIPEAVSENDQGYLLVNNDPILWTMLNAIKEQQHQITQQQAAAKQQQDQIAALRTANTALNARLQVIEQTLKDKRGSIRQRR